jgi:pimeloyl-ACP methyl ester carboxylesterase/photosystem II stability/assembly factor-like uncharacterized protein
MQRAVAAAVIACAAAAVLHADTRPVTWEPQASGVTVRLRGVSAVSATVAWASGAQGTVLRTTDGGRTWVRRTVPGAEALDFRDIDAASADAAHVLSIGPGEASRIYETRDGGATWTERFRNTEPKAFFDAMTFGKDGRGVAVSDSVDGRFVVVTTVDGGASWQPVAPDRLPPALEGEGAFAASGTNVAMVGDRIWFGTTKGRVLRSSDGGRSWSVHQTPIDTGEATGIFSVAFSDALHGVVVGGNYTKERERGHQAAVTSDGGTTWTLATTGVSGFRSAVAWLPRAPATWLSVGPAGADVSGDGGRSWMPAGGDGYDALSLAPGTSVGWATGAGGRIARVTTHGRGPAPGRARQGAPGPQAGEQPDTSIRPFRIAVPQAALDDLRARLRNPRLPAPLLGPGWDLGTDVEYLRGLLAYWRDRFDWRARERALNRLEQFTTEIDGLTIHFVHRRSTHAGAFPLLITHGWPGSIAEFTKIVDPLTDPPAHGGSAADAFHVVMPSIPGFGFSEAPREAGFDPARIAQIEAALMARLGYTRYGVQGGDWGSIIGTQVAARDPDHVAGLHLNMCIGNPPAGQDPEAGLTDAERARLKVRQTFQTEETGYQQIQGTKPQTIGIALNDSPVALAAWIVEKFRTWCDCDGHPERVFTKDELLTNLSIYWFTQTAASSARIYYESRHPMTSPVPGRIAAPMACADFPKEIIWSPRRWLESRYNIVRWTPMPKGGHFAALEQPALLVDDIRAFFRTVR